MNKKKHAHVITNNKLAPISVPYTDPTHVRNTAELARLAKLLSS